MKPYSVDIEVTTRYTIEIHANDEDEAQQIAEKMADTGDIGDTSDPAELQSIEVTNVEEITDDDSDD